MPRERKVVVESLPDEATRLAAELCKTIICESVAQRGRAYVALSGGITPRATYQLLAKTATTGAVPWSQVEVFFGDERDVPHDDVDSNFRMVQQTLLDYLPITPSQVHPMPADAEDLDRAAAAYEQTVRKIVPARADGRPCFDLILLGMGAEGHTASMFPCTPEALEEKTRLVVAHFVPVLGRRRMTFTFPLINAARNVIVLVTGDDKADVAATILDGDEQAKSKLPAARIAPDDGLCTLVLDAAAARRSSFRPA